jgi:SAM-dependent methyltransferase
VPTVTENKAKWDGAYEWNEQGDEWSGPWGQTPFQWYATLLPRIHSLVPASTLVEIACGYGRWTQYLKDLCDRLVAVDLSQECIDACRQRFAGSSNIDYHVTDGKTLDMVADGSVDFVFSFDSLVHADLTVLDAYLEQMGRKLSPEGSAFIHHSNLGEYQAKYRTIRRVPKMEGLLITVGAIDPFLHWRDPGVSAPAVARMAEAHGLKCITQEIVHWRTDHAFIDCMSTIVRRGSRRDRQPRVVRNDQFMAEARNAEQMSRLYGSK